MSTSLVTTHPLLVRDADFWREAREEVPMRAFREDRAGRLDEELLIDAPGAVDLSARRTLPLGFYWRAPLARAAALDPARHLRIAVVHLESHTAHAARAFEAPARRREPSDDDGPPFDPGEGVTSTLQMIELRERLALPWRQGTLLVTGILGDVVTNRLRIELAPGRRIYEDLAVAERLALLARQPRATRVLPEPGQPFPDYGFPMDARPDGVGITLEAPRVVELGAGAGVPLRGAFRLPLLPAERVPGDADFPALRATVGRQPLAIVPIRLIVVGSLTSDWAVIPLRVPVFDPPEEEAGGRALASGTFALNLLDFEDVPRDGGTLFVYAMADEVLAGPTRIGLVTPEML